MRRTHRGYIYLIGSSQFGWYKIGRSRSVAARISDLGILLPFRVEVFAVWGTSSPVVVERLFHERYSRHSINGEWFSFAESTLKKIVESEQPFDCDRVYPGISAPARLANFSNIPRDILQKSWNSNEFQRKPRIGVGFRELVDAWLNENGLEPTKGNISLASIAVRSLLSGKANKEGSVSIN